jgi:cyclic pyranopterin phosphate synthase
MTWAASAGSAMRRTSAQLLDGQGRRLEYLRLSVTDRCNFRCAYCLPNGCGPAGEAPLSGDEIVRLVRGFAALGVWKVRLTGGEPSVRRDLVDVVRAVAAVPGIRRVGLTTNGWRLAADAAALRDAGLTALNVSVDSLDAARFEAITGAPLLGRVVEGVEEALAAGIPHVKVNAVLHAGLEDAELDAFLEWTRVRPLAVRFIELMQTRDNADYFRRHHLPADAVARKLEARGWTRQARQPADGPAAVYAHPRHRGWAGLIAPYGHGFCDACNRVRVSSTGALKLCLFGDRELPLRHLLRADGSEGELAALVAAAVREKPAAHRLHEGRSGTTTSLAVIGG